MDEQRINQIQVFFSEPGLARFIDASRDTYRRRGVSGFVRVPQLSADECDSLAGLLGQLWKPGEDLKFSMKKLDNILQKSGYKITIQELLTCLDGQEVLTRAEEEQQAERNWNQFIDEALQTMKSGKLPVPIVEWVEGLRKGAAQGSRRILRGMYIQNPGEAQQHFVYCLDALCRVWELKQKKDTEVECAPPEKFIRLPVLAAKVAKNAHRFDFKYPVGRLLWYSLREIFSREFDHESSDFFQSIASGEEWESSSTGSINENDEVDPVKSLEIRKMYRFAGIADDDISSQVILFAPQLTEKKEEIVLTLRQVERLPAIQPFSALYAVENPSVFATLLDETLQWENPMDLISCDSLPIFICLNGQPSAATIRFIDRCLETNDHHELRLHYSGDFDVKGLEIAQGLARRYRKHFVPWRMSFSDYERHTECGMSLSDTEKQKLRKMTVDWDDRLCSKMCLIGVKIHQEIFVEELLRDWMEANGMEV
ncbi:TIGR02679 domain-containing protein [Brevibacillus ruminantium]|uniref:TIGR02679 domain-containing protein n=1 Tax=Brevibacillus ruminantium TaxID=2950604 RepID=A0ABY4WIB4_9BACL|nr:TIGR02679 domain-containing protein [Brevibacillus ruminantium]USG65089.1 TIGR02679 domain-containing protein [Brevibacillus ruminantium]